MDNKRVAVILSGCGVYDGAEINEVVLTLLALESLGIGYQCFAPNSEQYHVIDHITGEPVTDQRNVMTEAARIVRGQVKPVTECQPGEFCAVIVPGGFGVAKNLSDFAMTAENMVIRPDVLAILQQFKEAGKPAGYMCIAPVLLPIVYGEGVLLTVGNDTDTIAIVEKMGGKHQEAGVGDIVVDTVNNVVTTPAYMLATSLTEAKQGIDKLVNKITQLS